MSISNTVYNFDFFHLSFFELTQIFLYLCVYYYYYYFYMNEIFLKYRNCHSRQLPTLPIGKSTSGSSKHRIFFWGGG